MGARAKRFEITYNLAAVALASGSRLGSYEIAERIGAGGMGEVYRATDTTLGRAAHVAVSTEGATAPRWRHDGKELFYLRSDDTLMAVSIRASATTIDVGTARAMFQTAFQGSGLTTSYDVAPDGRFLVLRDVDEPLPPAITLVINWPAGLANK